jgi:hypothetical protein
MKAAPNATEIINFIIPVESLACSGRGLAAIA